jgi:hypothetical protein
MAATPVLGMFNTDVKLPAAGASTETGLEVVEL